MWSGFVPRPLRYYLPVRIFVAFNKILSFVRLTIYRSGSHYILKRTYRRGRLFPYLLLPVDSLTLSSVSWRWVARNVVERLDLPAPHLPNRLRIPRLQRDLPGVRIQSSPRRVSPSVRTGNWSDSGRSRIMDGTKLRTSFLEGPWRVSRVATIRNSDQRQNYRKLWR